MTTPAEIQPLATLECVVLDCPDPGELATFYGSLLGGAINQPDPRSVMAGRPFMCPLVTCWHSRLSTAMSHLAGLIQHIHSSSTWTFT
jgi:hypothetical protein